MPCMARKIGAIMAARKRRSVESRSLPAAIKVRLKTIKTAIIENKTVFNRLTINFMISWFYSISDILNQETSYDMLIVKVKTNKG